MRSSAQLSDAHDRWLAELLPPVAGVALVAVGSLGRRECVTHSDLDLVLLHTGQPRVREIAEAVWYPIWDSGTGLDHAVRTVDEAVQVARKDVKAALGLLDARCVAGDRSLADSLGQAVRDAWRSNPARWLGELRELTDARWQANGELAFLLEPDLKESRGGLRDAVTLRAIGYAQLVDPPRGAVREAYWWLLDVRDALHRSSGRGLDRLLLSEQDAVAESLGCGDADDLMRRVSDAARTIAHAADNGWRQVDRWLASRRRLRRRRPVQTRRPLADGVVEQTDEVVLARDADPAVDPALALRVAAAAATSRLPVGRGTLDRLSAHSPPLPDVWPEGALRSLVTLLGAGSATVEVWESFDRAGLIERWIPEWGRVRSLPQRNAVHRFTVDRHLVEAAAAAANHTRRVSRPDLLLLAALLHDIGKGLGGDHSAKGAEIARGIVVRWGLPEADQDVIVRLVAQHLLLADTATRRDLDDPATLQFVADSVAGDHEILDLLHALTESDAAATGPAAWSGWKERLVADLVRRTHELMGDGPAPAAESLAAGLPAALGVDPAGLDPEQPAVVKVDGDRLMVLASGEHLLSAAAGVLALHRMDVYAADAAEVAEKATAVVLRAAPRFGTPPDPELLIADLRRALRGGLRVGEQLSHREAAEAPSGPVRPPRVVWLHDVATDATVLELRAADRRGLLYRVAAALESVAAPVRAARVSTFGADAVDAFYLVGAYADPLRRAEVERAVLAAASGADAAATA
ncbi:MAG: glnD [Actinomycetia bacterium]|nr:glnD [Actinomycetes bacterium]